MPHFPSEQLLTFATVLSEGTLDAAARLLHITPSAVSQRLKALEQSAGRVLLQRSNPAQATEAGEVVLRLARQMAQLEADAGRELGLDGDGAPLAVPVVVNADSLAVWFLQALAQVPEGLNVTFDLHRDDEQHSTSLLRSGTVMAAVTATPEPVQGCRVESLGVMRYRAVAAPQFVKRWFPGMGEGMGERSVKRMDGATLNAATTVDFDRKDTYQWAFVQAAFRAEGRPAPERKGPRHYVPASQDFGDAIRLGLGWGLIPEVQCGPDIADGRLLELAPDNPFDVPLYWQRWRTASRVLDVLSHTVREVSAQYLRKS
ncbi:LysR family transcriptional regulator ArgP [Paenarthrobacter aurescens]|uniref:Transcriptional regulator ArgP n=1 Tax=Paenarthrobacter aurescens TaxID=43663 RepID=A0A4Y3NGH7_PAEAU|nr:LysR family transcriptional regulator ArgP [Paenarthrobacter aurescens]MDO6142589.1 LysR family transcriptional regulator ArgP [Paenarthrobacter aurescens]MDO6146436.1 LysR family transcriptional regulator ArgP [Paenarthrobacter aurescens]MDO6157681.1 LysR family transcriptional regulator ArgP [Paenarthrobacter aurescens]MDO6161666.1 LysR family transcriptional regulator ArgP [Paenarthrobacter aurescens]GEB20792.1 transcriptional regulator ArgP [Paenarthrobacter aurescens]